MLPSNKEPDPRCTWDLPPDPLKRKSSNWQGGFPTVDQRLDRRPALALAFTGTNFQGFEQSCSRTGLHMVYITMQQQHAFALWQQPRKPFQNNSTDVPENKEPCFTCLCFLFVFADPCYDTAFYSHVILNSGMCSFCWPVLCDYDLQPCEP